jgi:VanZ family protein
MELGYTSSHTPSTAQHPSRNARRFRWFMTIAWAGLIFYLSTEGFGASFTKWLLFEILDLLRVTVSAHTFEVLHLCLRKLAHVTEYGIFSLLLYASFLDAADFEWRPRLAVRCIVIAGLYSLTDEYHQSFVAGRTPSLIDCGIDTVGASLYTLIVLGWDRWCQTMRRRKAAAAASAPPAAKGAAGL